MAAREPDRGAVLISGATGFVGGEIVERYLRETDRRLIALVRAPDQEAARQRVEEILAERFERPAEYAGRIEGLCADLDADRLGLEADAYDRLSAEVTEVIHSAASVAFTQPLAEARAINVEGTRRMLDLAAASAENGGLRRYLQVSTAYVAGDHAGPFRESELDVGQDFRNSYERSKFEAERLVEGYADRLPTVIARPSIIVGHSVTGWTSSFNVLYPPLKAFSRGAYPAIPARRSTPVDIVPVDYVAAAIVELCESGEAGGAYHLVSGKRATTVGRLLDRASGYFDRPAPRLVPPRLYERLLHPVLVRVGDQRRRRALRRSKQLFPYFSMRVRFDDARAQRALQPAGISVEEPERYLDRLLDFAVLARWGKRQPVRRERGWRRRLAGRPR